MTGVRLDRGAVQGERLPVLLGQPEGDLVHLGHRRRRAGVQQQRELGEAEVIATGGADDAGQDPDPPARW